MSRRYPMPEHRVHRQPVRLEPSLRRSEPRPDPRDDRRRPLGPSRVEGRPRLIAPSRPMIAPRRSEPITRHVEPMRSRGMPSVSPMDRRRMMQPARSFEHLSRYAKPSRPEQESRVFARPSDPPRPRFEPRSAERAELM